MSKNHVRSGKLTEGPIAPLLLGLSLPMFGSNILQPLNGSINAVWIGHLLGPTALAAASNTTLIMFLMINAFIGLSAAASIFAGQALGRADGRRAKQVVGTSFTVMLALSVCVAVLGALLTPTIVGWLGVPADALNYTIDYLRWTFVAIPAMALVNLVTNLLGSAGDTRTPLLAAVLSVALDAALNPVFTLGLAGAPRLGIIGSAVSMLVAQCMALAVMVIRARAKKSPLWLQPSELGLLRPDGPLVRTLLSKGAFIALQGVVFSISSLMIIGLVNRYGSPTAAAYGVATQLWAYLQMPTTAMSIAVASIAAQSYGAGLWPRVLEAGRVGFWMNLALSAVLITLFYGIQGWVLRLFLPPSSEAFEIAWRMNTIVAWSFFFFSITLVAFGVVRSTGIVVPQVAIVILSLICMRVPFAYLLSPRFGADAIWWAFPVGSVASALLALTYYRFGGWRRRPTPQPADG